MWILRSKQEALLDQWTLCSLQGKRMRKKYTTTTANLISEVWSKDIERAMLRPRLVHFGKAPKPTRWQSFRYWLVNIPPLKLYRKIGKWITRKLMNHFDIQEDSYWD